MYLNFAPGLFILLFGAWQTKTARQERQSMGKILIIAEAGVNHNGSLELAYKMVDAAKEAGADIIKFQTGKPENVVSRFAEKALYQKETTGENESQLQMLKHLSLSFDEFKKLYNYCQTRQITFLSTPFDIESIEFLYDLVELWKIPSGEITNLPYLIEIAKKTKPVIMSTGMSTLDEIRSAVDVLKKYKTTDITLLHCNTQYPTPYQDVNLKAMHTLKKEFGVSIGYSDHTNGIEVSTAAAALGAEVIEKHFTLSRNMSGPDHKASLEPGELKAMITAIRHIEAALGSEEKKVTPSERENINIARKSIVAKTKIKKGEILSERNITTKRPGNGISPMRWFEAIGSAALKDFEEDELIIL